jgi:GTPase Era involved in 16S rRNA processing
MAGKTIVEESPVVDTTKNITFSRINTRVGITFIFFDTPGFYGLSDYPSDHLIKSIDNGHNKCKNDKTKMNMSYLHPISPLIKKYKPVFRPGFHIINSFVIDMANGFKRADLNAFNKMKKRFPNIPIIIVANKCQYVSQYSLDKILKEINRKVQVPIIRRFSKESKRGNSRFRSKFLSMLCEETINSE